MSMDNGQGEPAQVPIGVQLGLGPLWQPSQQGYNWIKLSAPDGSPMYVLIVSGVTGTYGFSLDYGAMEAFMLKAREVFTGLTVAKELPQQPPGNPFQGGG